MSKPSYPKKGLGSYLLPFLLIILLIGSGIYILQNNINLDDLKRVFKAPEVAKDEKVEVIFSEGNPQIKPWSEQDWREMESDDVLQPGDTLKTTTGELLVLRFFEESEVRLGPDSTLKLIQMERDPIAGDQIALELVAGRLWRRGVKGNTPDSDFIIRTNFQILQMNDPIMLDLKTNPDTTRVIGGSLTDNISEQNNGARKPVSRLDLSAGQELVLDTLTIDMLKAGDTDVTLPLTEDYLNSQWYVWNMDKEEKLGFLVEPELLPDTTAELQDLEEGLVEVLSPIAGTRVGSSIQVTGTYDSEKIESIWVNNQEAIFGFNGDWEASVTLSESKSELLVTAQELSSEEEKRVTVISLDVDTSGPTFGEVTQPEIDENGNGTLDSDDLELLGEVSSDAQQVCVMHNDKAPAYCLKQFSAGDESYRYVGSVGYGNVVEGRNKYTITATDSLGNVSQKVIYLFKGVEKPSTAIDEPSTTTAAPSDSSAPEAPVITDPDPGSDIQVDTETITVSGTVSAGTTSLLVNEKKADYTSGSGSFTIDVPLEVGENLLKFQAVNAQGKGSKTSVLRVFYFEKELEEPEL